LIGGCLEVIDWLRGIPISPDHAVWQDSIVFLEISGEAPSASAFVRMLRALSATGALDKVRGILFGRPFGDEANFGHTDPRFIVPYGIEAEMDCDARNIRFLESATI
jgi:muramoyltetrapeptide carboxypeptidase LdcA involved in peptidoglycan recycling